MTANEWAEYPQEWVVDQQKLCRFHTKVQAVLARKQQRKSKEVHMLSTLVNLLKLSRAKKNILLNDLNNDDSLFIYANFIILI